MTTLTHRFLISTAAVLLAGASATAMARGTGACDASPDGTPNGPRAEQMQQRMADHHAQRQTELKAKLKLSADQEAAWAQFALATQPMAWAAGGTGRPQVADMAKLTTPERIDAMQALKTQRDAQMTKKGDATKAFYASLTPEQKATFDAETARRGMGHRHGGGHMKGHMKG